MNLFTVFLSIALFLSCAKAGQKDEDPTANTSDLEAASYGEILFSLPTTIERDSLKFRPVVQQPFTFETIHEEGEQNQQILVRLKRIPRGIFQFTVQGKSADGVPFAALIKDINVVPKQTTLVTRQTIPLAGKFTGVVYKAQQQDHAGIKVEIPNTDLTATTDAKGNFTIEHVPPGQHNILITHGSFRNGELRLQVVEPAQNKFLQEMTLVGNTYKDGSIYIDNLEHIPNTENRFKVSFVTVPAASAIYYKTAPNREGLNTAPWSDLITNFTAEYEGSGTKELFIQFATEGEKPLSVYSTTFELQSE